MTKWNMIINVGRCVNCYNCVISERDEHVGDDFPVYAAPAALTGDSPIRILRRVQGSAPMVDTTCLPVMCNQCDNPPCQKVGGDAICKREDGIVIIDPVKARGRGDIVKSCPYGAIVWNEEQQALQTWVFDAHLLDFGMVAAAMPAFLSDRRLRDAADRRSSHGRTRPYRGTSGTARRPRNRAAGLVSGPGTLGHLLRRRRRQRNHRGIGRMRRRGDCHPFSRGFPSGGNRDRRLRRFSFRPTATEQRRLPHRSSACARRGIAAVRTGRKSISGRDQARRG